MRMLKSALVVMLGVLSPQALASEDLPRPTGPVVLTVDGNISRSNGEGIAQFDLAMLDALAQRTTITETPWYDGAQSFSGVVVSALLEAVGAEGATITVRALNDYSADIPADDFKANPVILATRLNGEVLSVREKGPLFVIYPFELDPSLYNEVYFGRSVWQVTAMSVN